MKAKKGKQKLVASGGDIAAGIDTPQETNPAELTPSVPRPQHLALSFIFPFVIFGTVFALHKVYPFGDRQILITDFWQQYYPFFNTLWHKIREGTLSTWSWTAGAGSDYLALAAYYMASPLNLLAMIVPHALLREALTVVLLVKIGLAGLFMGSYLRYAFRQSGLALPFFATLYALCAFTLGYYWNIMWFDSFALMPLVIQGLTALMREGKLRLYIISLALAVATNYYIGFFICVFVVMTFFGQSIISGLKPREFLRKLAFLAFCSVIAAGLAAIVLIPAYFSLQRTYSAVSSFPAYLKIINDIFNVLGNFIAFTPATSKEGFPNLYSGMISIMFAGLFLFSKKIPRREKLVNFGALVFLLLSCNINVLDYMWNGFHYANMLPFRFSFLVSFMLVAMAYRTFMSMDRIDRRSLAVMGISAAFIILTAVCGSQKRNYITGSAGLCILYLIILDLSRDMKGRKRAIINMAFLLVILTEVSVSAFISIKTSMTTVRDTYPGNNDAVQQLLDMRGEARPDFYRTEMTYWFTLNGPSLYYYDGISIFSSTANVNVSNFMGGLGLPWWGNGNRYYYAETSPLTNALLSVRYLVSSDGHPVEPEFFWKIAGKAGKALLLENNRHLPLGFMVDENLANYVHYDNNPFLSQNNLFRLATGLNENLFVVTDMNNQDFVSRDEYDNLKWDYEMPADGMLYAYCAIDKTENVRFHANGTNTYTIIARPYIFTLGSYSQGDIIYISADEKELTSPLTLYMAYLNPAVFDKGYEIFSREKLVLSEFSETVIKGSVTAAKDGLLYTSIPADSNWSAFVDGVKTPIILIDGCMAALRLSEGTHSVEFRYFNRELVPGFIVSFASLAIFALMILVQLRKEQAKGENPNV